MYNRDATEIATLAKHNNSVAPIIGFTLSTIQAGLQTCTGQAQKVIDNGYSANCLWGLKAEGLKYAIDNDAWLYQKAMHIVDQYGYDSVDGITEAILLFMHVPNLGMVKASFVCQMLGFNVSCLDSHNLKRLGMNANFTKVPATMSDSGKRKKIAVYVALCQEQGTEYWWNSWCDYVAGNQANRSLVTGDIVSRFHVECINLWAIACDTLRAR
tara:strand:+ start:618 stop:1256 length:639 start_codon:yes stop_codon:yes gene_type:complete